MSPKMFGVFITLTLIFCAIIHCKNENAPRPDKLVCRPWVCVLTERNVTVCLSSNSAVPTKLLFIIRHVVKSKVYCLLEKWYV